jgi:gamma-glutamyltranspeptidase/glutathione hydrolase
MAATSQPLATRVALRMLEEGGNAADAAIAAAAVVCVTEPMATGVGGDAFAIVWRDGKAIALDAAGPAPAGADPAEPVAVQGPRSVTVPGAVGGWAALSERFGRLALDTCLAPAIDIAAEGFAVGARTAAEWARPPGPPEGFAPAPRAGSTFRHPQLAASLRAIATGGPAAVYTGELAGAIAEACWLEPEDLAAYAPRWVEPLRGAYREVEVLELPPPTQGVAALEALALLERLTPTPANQATAARLALEDALATVRDGADVSDLLDEAHVTRRLEDVPAPVREPGGGTAYLCVVDPDRMAVSFIQSLFFGFGSGTVVPGTGIVLHNRGASFALQGAVAPGQRPYHTIIPALALRDGGLLGPFGIMGGFIQAQAHAQFISAVVDDGLDPQAALDRPRFRVDGDALVLETGLDPAAFAGVGLDVRVEPDFVQFGGGQAILVEGDGLVGGSDSRKDGVALGL